MSKNETRSEKQTIKEERKGNASWRVGEYGRNTRAHGKGVKYQDKHREKQEQEQQPQQKHVAIGKKK